MYGADTAVLWTSLFRMALDGRSVIKNGTVEEIQLLREASRDILLAEIVALKPTAILFFTGPDYNEHLYAIFPGCEHLELAEYDPTRTSLLQHPMFPHPTLRTYHPGYLSRGHWHIVDLIGSIVAELHDLEILHGLTRQGWPLQPMYVQRLSGFGYERSQAVVRRLEGLI